MTPESYELANVWFAVARRYVHLDENRAGDHICYYSDLRKMRNHYPRWDMAGRLNKQSAGSPRRGRSLS